MKKEYFGALALFSIFALQFASCQKALENGDSTSCGIITRTIAVNAETVPEMKSVFESGKGVHLTNSEYMTVYYAKAAGGESVSSQSFVIANPDTKGNWSFSHTAIDGAEQYDYGFVIPHTNGNERTGAGAKLRLFCVQRPSAGTFDPDMDFLVGKAQLGVSQATAYNSVSGSASVKRLFAPVKVRIKDGANVLDGEKIHAVSFSLDKTATKQDALVGQVYVTLSDEFDNTKVSKFSTDNSANNFGNSVTALIAEGIEKGSDGFYDIWYIMNPMEIPAGTQLTLTVTADTKTVSRTVTLPQDSILKNKITEIPIDISKENYTVQNSAYCDFSTIAPGDLATCALSDDTTPLSATGCNQWGKNRSKYYPQAFTMLTQQSSTITITPPKGKKLSKVRVYSHPATPYNTNTRTLELKSGDTSLGSVNTKYGEASASAGCFDFTVADEYASSELKLTQTADNSWVSGITLFYAE